MYNEVFKWLESDDFSAIDYYKTLVFSKLNDFTREYTLMLTYNKVALKRAFVNNSNNEYNALFKEVVGAGDLELLEVLNSLKLTNKLIINEIIEIAIINKREEIGLELISNLEKYFTEPFIILNKIDLINKSLGRRLDGLSKELLRLFIVKFNKPPHNFSSKELEKIEEMFQVLAEIGELDFMKIVQINAPLIFNEFYSPILIEALSRGYIDVIAYYDRHFKFRQLPDNDKIELLELALQSDEVVFFEMVVDYLKPLNLESREAKVLLDKAKEQNRDIFALLYQIK